jgi:hypothetical protein
MSALKKGRSEARPRADVRTRGRVRELFSVESSIKMSLSTYLRGALVPPCFVNLPESYKDALADVTGTFRAGFQPFHCSWVTAQASEVQHPERRPEPRGEPVEPLVEG